MSASVPSPLIAAPLGRLLGALPAFPGSALFATALNMALARQIPADVAQALAGKALRLRVTDAHWAFDFTWRHGRFAPLAASAQPDLTIGACAWDLALLARRAEDPDTLFFSRRLVMEGDTELGLLVKNTLDALEWPVFDPQQFKPAQVLARWRAGLGRHPRGTR